MDAREEQYIKNTFKKIKEHLIECESEHIPEGDELPVNKGYGPDIKGHLNEYRNYTLRNLEEPNAIIGSLELLGKHYIDKYSDSKVFADIIFAQIRDAICDGREIRPFSITIGHERPHLLPTDENMQAFKQHYPIDDLEHRTIMVSYTLPLAEYKKIPSVQEELGFTKEVQQVANFELRIYNRED